MTSYVAQANTGADELVSSRSVTKPGSVGAGHVGVFWLARWNESASFPAVTPPTGAVLAGTATGSNLQTLCYLLKITDESAFNFTWTGARWSTLCGVFVSGVDPALDLSTVPFNTASGSSSALGTTTVTTVADAALAWHVNNISGASGFTHTPPAGFTEVADIAQWSAAYRISPGAGGQSAADAAMSGSTAWAAALVALAPASTVVEGDADLDVTASLAAGGARAAVGAAALATTANLTAAGQRGATGGAARTVQAQLAAAGAIRAAAAAGLAASVQFTASGVVTGPVVRGSAAAGVPAVAAAGGGVATRPTAMAGLDAVPTAMGGG
ncbi:hypothetical protein ACIP4S_13040 [Streptomyces chartreusis]|uniref:hypothetical protein n=1 Tax=Streptomyces chartreusis TaxID=1969 RepID=UPI00380104F5